MTAHFFSLLDDLLHRSFRMAGAVEHMLATGGEALERLDAGLARTIIEQDRTVDEEEVAIEKEALRLMTLFQPMGADMRRLCTVLKVNNDLERIADCAVNIAQRVCRISPGVLRELGGDLAELYRAVRRMLRDALNALALVDEDAASGVRGQDAQIDGMYARYVRKVIAAAGGRDPGGVSACVDVLAIAKSLERIADHAANIAEDVIYMGSGRIVRHSVARSR